MKGKTPVTQAELQRAIMKYLKSGGRIQKLPDQKFVPPTVIGRRWSSTEMETGQISP